MKVIAIYLALLFFHARLVLGQSVQIDSLEHILKKQTENEKIRTLYILAERYIQNAQFIKGLDANQKLLELSKKLKSLEGETLYYRNQTLFHRFDEMAFHYHWQAHQILEKRSKYIEAKILWQKYQINSNLYKERTSTDSLVKAVAFYEKSGNEFLVAETAKSLAGMYIQQKKLPEALIYQQKAFGLYQKLSHPQGTISSMLNGIVIFERQNLKEKALKLELELVNVINQMTNQHDAAICLHMIGHFYYRSQNRYALAIEYFLKASQITQNIDETLLSLELFYIGLLYRNQEYNAKASEYFQILRVLAEEKPSKCLVNLGEIYNALGFSLGSENKLKEALEYHLKANEVAKKINDKQALAQGLDGIGQVYQKQGEYQKALDYYFEALSHFDTISNNILTSYIYLYIGQCYHKLKQQEKSLEYALKSYELSVQTNWGVTMIKSSLLLAEVYGKLEKYEQAYEFQKKHLIFRDSILSKDNANHLIDVEIQVALQQTKQAIKLLEKDKKIQEEENKNQRLLLASVLGILAVLGLLAAMLYRNNHAKKKANQKLLAQKLEIEQQAQKLAQVNATKDKLFAIIGHDLRSPLNSLKGLMDLLVKQNISAEEFIMFSGKLRNGVEHVYFTLNNLLVWANSQMQGIRVKPKFLEINILVNQNFDFLEEIARSKQIQLENLLPLEVKVWADEQLISLAIRNLISNALKFTPEGGTVKVAAQQKDNQWEIGIEDTGVGMSKETLAKLFRTDIHTTTQGTNGEKGTGLGLLLCKEMIEKNHGTIWVESEEGKGSTFRFSLPITEIQ